MHKITLVTLFTIFISFSSASSLQLVASTGNEGKYLPPISYLSNVSPQISNNGDITFFTQGLFGDVFSHGIFVKDADYKVGKLRRVLDQGEYISSLSINDHGKILIATNDGASSKDTLEFDFIKDTLHSVISPDENTFSMTSMMLNNNSDISYRLKNTEGIKSLVYKKDGVTTTILKEGKQGVSYIFSPVLKGNWLVVKVRYGELGQYDESRPDKLWLFDLKNNKRSLVALDKDAMPSSKISSIENFYTVNALGHVAFWARTRDGRVLYLQGTKPTQVVLKESSHFKKVDLFKPSLNDLGQIVIRATNLDSTQVISIYDQGKWKEIISEGDQASDDTDSYMVTRSRDLTFIGAPMINNLSQVVFNANTTILKNSQKVEAIYKLDLNKSK